MKFWHIMNPMNLSCIPCTWVLKPSLVAPRLLSDSTSLVCSASCTSLVFIAFKCSISTLCSLRTAASSSSPRFACTSAFSFSISTLCFSISTLCFSISISFTLNSASSLAAFSFSATAAFASAFSLSFAFAALSFSADSPSPCFDICLNCLSSRANSLLVGIVTLPPGLLFPLWGMLSQMAVAIPICSLKSAMAWAPDMLLSAMDMLSLMMACSRCFKCCFAFLWW